MNTLFYRGQITFLFLLIIVSLASDISIAASNIHTIRIVDYFAGKDENCLVLGPNGVEKSRRKKFEFFSGTIVQIVNITNFFGATDSESYCTLVVESEKKSAKGKAESRRFSASPDTCAKGYQLAGKGQVAVHFAEKLHVCQLESFSK